MLVSTVQVGKLPLSNSTNLETLVCLLRSASNVYHRQLVLLSSDRPPESLSQSMYMGITVTVCE